jgi:putative ABC transport system substrate-binding protein
MTMYDPTVSFRATRFNIVFIPLLALAVLAGPLAAEAQRAERVYRVGYLAGSSGATDAPLLAAFRQGLSELGYVEGRNLVLEVRSAEGKLDRFSSLARELVRLTPDVLMVATIVGAQAARSATTTIPIVFVRVGDPVGAGLVPDLAHPAGNITGITNIMAELTGKRLELLKEMVPTASRVAIFVNPDAPIGPLQIRGAETAAKVLGIQLLPVLAMRGTADLRSAFEGAVGSGASAVLRLVDFTMDRLRVETAKLAVKHRLPAMYPSREDVEAGGMMAYGPDVAAQYRQAAGLVHKILRGAKPADLPVEQPTKFELTINAKTVKALGLTIPPSLRLRADQVIDR